MTPAGKLAVLALAASLCVVSTAPSSGCQDFSSAKKLVDAVAVDGKNYLISLTTNMTVLQAAIARIFNTARSVDQGYFTRFAVGTKDAVSLEFVNCWAIEMSNNTYCQRGFRSQWIISIAEASSKLFGTPQQQVYVLLPGGILGTRIGQIPSDYNLKSQAWYTQNSYSWSTDFTYVNRAVGSIYSASVISNAESLFLATAAAWWTSAEPCLDLCQTQSFANSVVDAVASAPSGGTIAGLSYPANALSQANDTAAIVARLQLLLAASSAYDNGYATVVELALTTGDYYAIEDCSVSGRGSAYCCRDPKQRYLAYVLNPRLGDSLRHVYKVDNTLSASNFASSEFASDDFSSLLADAAWNKNAVVGGIWSKLATKVIDGGLFPDQCSASPLDQGRAQTYSKRFTGGVVSAYRFENDPCVDGCSANSRARVVVSELGTLVPQLRNDPATTADLSARISILTQGLIAPGDGYTNLVYSRSSTGQNDFVAVEWCYQPDASFYCRDASSQYVAYASSLGVFADRKLRVFGVSESYLPNYAAPVFTSTGDFNVSRDFTYYKSGSSSTPSQSLNGFSDSFSMPNGRLGRVFQKQVMMDSTAFAELGAVEAISRIPCFSTCEGNSFAATAARASSAIAVTSLTAIPSASGLCSVADTMLTLMAAFTANSDSNYKLEYALENGDYYAVTRCTAVENLYNSWCREDARRSAPSDLDTTTCSSNSASTGVFNNYIAYLRVANVFGPSLQVYQLSSSGVLGAKLGMEGESTAWTRLFVPQRKAWGWLDPVENVGTMYSATAGTGTWIQSYVVPIYDGITDGVPKGSPGHLRAIVQGTRSGSDPCSQKCLLNSWGLPTTYMLSQAASGLSTFTTTSQIVKVLSVMMSSIDFGYDHTVSYFTAAGDYYAVRDCTVAANLRDVNCLRAGPAARQIAIVYNSLDSASIRSFEVDAAGLLGQQLSTSNAIDPMRAAIISKQNGYIGNVNGDGVFVTQVRGSNGAVVGTIAASRSRLESCDNKCLKNSWAVPAAKTLATKTLDRFVGLTSWTDVSNALVTLWTAFDQNDQGSNVMLYIGTNDGDFYGIKTCRTAATLLSDSFCQTAGRKGISFIFYVRNDKIGPTAFGGTTTAFAQDTSRYVFGAYVANGTMLSNDYLGKENGRQLAFEYLGKAAAYDTTSRDWFTQQVGWTKSYAFASGHQGRTYAYPAWSSDTSKGVIGVIGADRYEGEPCSPSCQQNTWAVPAARQLVANGNLNRFQDVDSSVTVAAAIAELFKAYQNNDHGNNVELWFAMTNGDFYQLMNCRSVANQLNEFCRNPATTARLLAVVKNKLVFGDNLRRVYQLTDSGSIFKLIGASKEPFDPLKQAWYKIGSGFTTYTDTGQPETFSVLIPKTGITTSTQRLGALTAAELQLFETNIAALAASTANIPSSAVGVAGGRRYRLEPCADACLVNSWAVAATHAFAVGGSSSFLAPNAPGMTTMPGVQSVIRTMYTTFKDSDHGHNVRMSYGTRNGDLYELHNCWLGINNANQYCQQSGLQSWLVAYIKNSIVFGDNNVHVYTLRSCTSRTECFGQMIAKLGSFTPSVDFRNERWFVTNMGWSAKFSLGNEVAQTYSVPVSFALDGITPSAIVAGYRISSELCYSGLDQDVPSTRVRVKTLDTIQSLAESYGFTWHQMLLLNSDLKNPSQLIANTFLYHSMLYIVKKGDTLFSVAQMYGISWMQLWLSNPQIPYTALTLDWRQYPSNDPSGAPYYRNLRTKQVQWEKPAELIQAELTDLQIYEGQKLAVRPNLISLICQNKFYS